MFCECVGWHSYEKNHNSIMFVWGLFCILRIALKPDRKYAVRLISKTAISSSGKSASLRSWLRGVRVPEGGPLSVSCVVSSAGQSNCLLSNRSLVRIQYNAPHLFSLARFCGLFFKCLTIQAVDCCLVCGEFVKRNWHGESPCAEGQSASRYMG